MDSSPFSSPPLSARKSTCGLRTWWKTLLHYVSFFFFMIIAMHCQACKDKEVLQECEICMIIKDQREFNAETGDQLFLSRNETWWKVSFTTRNWPRLNISKLMSRGNIWRRSLFVNHIVIIFISESYCVFACWSCGRKEIPIAICLGIN